MKKTLYEGCHAQVATGIGCVGYVYNAMRNVEIYLDFSQRALSMLQSSHQGDHTEVAKVLDCVGKVLEASGKVP